MAMITGDDRDDIMTVNEEDNEFKGLGDGLFDEENEEDNEFKEQGDDKDTFPQQTPQAQASAVNKKTWKTLTPRQRAIKVILRRAGKDQVPDIKKLLMGKQGVEVAIGDIALFINDKHDDEVLSELAKECPNRNRINLSAEVQKKRVLSVGAQVISAGRMYQPIHVARIKEDGKLECTSGRHRLAFLALMYGANTKIPVYIEEMTLNEARDAVVVANQTRPTKALERAEHAVLQAVKGNAEAAQDDLYYKTVTCKQNVSKYCVFSVVSRGYPMRLSFPVSTDSSRQNGCLTTLANVENYWRAAIEWTDGMKREDFDKSLKESVRFLNALVAAMHKQKGFDPKQHLASMTLVAIGKYYRTYSDITGNNAIEVVEDIAKNIVKMGDIGRQKTEKTNAALTAALSPTR